MDGDQTPAVSGARYRAQEYGVHEAEDRKVDPDAERQRQHGNNRETAAPPKQAYREAHVLQQ
jgi:hypothetical protein